MIRQAYEFEIITPCFSGGANPETTAEIRASAIRGQLRWWFRVLGGFKSLKPLHGDVHHQESVIFGDAANEDAASGVIQVRAISGTMESITQPTMNDLAPDFDPKGYLVFPLRDKLRAAFYSPDQGAHGGFVLLITLRDNRILSDDIAALVTVFANLGSLGFRSRRATGALRFKDFPYPLSEAFKRFGDGDAINSPGGPLQISKIGGVYRNVNDCVAELAKWLKAYREHGQSMGSWSWIDKSDKKSGAKWKPADKAAFAKISSGRNFGYARRDHNEGLTALGHTPPDPDPLKPAGKNGETFRPALGLPIIQKFSSIGSNASPGSKAETEVVWNQTSDGGRFASPVILRPHRAADGSWHALVIFVDSKKWNIANNVYLNGTPRKVSLALYDAMKSDITKLKPFP